MSNYTRRNFLKNSALCSALFGLPMLATEASAAPVAKGKNKTAAAPTPAEQVEITSGIVLLFQGDSITDAHRAKTGSAPNRPNHQKQLGDGFVNRAAGMILNTYAKHDVKIFNRGISGNKVSHLLERWEKDTIALKPDILCILIGVNDFWRTMDKGEPGTAESYETSYRELLKITKEKLPKTRIIICEPFVLETGKAVTKEWFPKFDGYRAAAKKLAEEFKLTFVPFQTVFNEASKRAPNTYWTDDGVHPTIAGQQLMAEACLTYVK